MLQPLLVAQTALPGVKPISRVQAVPEPYDQISFRREEKEITRYHFSPTLNRPFVYPVNGTSGRTLTRMGHPGDPFTHSHHNSIWISYGRVNGVDFWGDQGKNRGRIVHQRTLEIEDGDDRAGVITQADWTAADGKVLLRETRETWVYPLAAGEWMLVLDLLLAVDTEPAIFESAGFGPIGVRVAKSIAVHFGGGRIRNSDGAEGEREVFRKPTRWVDYSGQVAPGVVEGLTLMDHPVNPRHPSPFHVREDGWMGAMLSTEGPVTVKQGSPLHLRYGVYVHAGLPPPTKLDERWTEFVRLDLHPPLGPPKSESDCLHGGHRKFNRPRQFKSTTDCLDFVKVGKAQ
jgi:hypothetical protein